MQTYNGFKNRKETKIRQKNILEKLWRYALAKGNQEKKESKEKKEDKEKKEKRRKS